MSSSRHNKKSKYENVAQNEEIEIVEALDRAEDEEGISTLQKAQQKEEEK